MTQPKDKIQYIDPKKLRVPEVRITTVWEQDDLNALGTDIAKYGIEDPLKIADDGMILWIVDGRHRQEEALLKGLPTVPCVVRQMDLKTQLLRNLASNHLRGTVKVSDEIKVVKELMASHNANSDEIAEKAGLSRERVETMMLIAAGHPDLIAFLDDGRIKLGHAKAIVRIPDLQVQSQLCYIVQQHGVTVENIDRIVRMTIEEMEVQKNPQRSVVDPKQHAEPTIECACCHEEVPIRYAVSIILCQGCNGILMSGVRYAEEMDKQPAQTDPKVESKSES